MTSETQAERGRGFMVVMLFILICCGSPRDTLRKRARQLNYTEIRKAVSLRRGGWGAVMWYMEAGSSSGYRAYMADLPLHHTGPPWG